MQLSREAVKRMVGTGGEYSFVGGSGQQANMAGYASLSFVEENYVSKVFFARLFTVYDANGNAVIPNDADTAIDNIKAMVGLWTNQYLSALGQNSEGGGGGSSTLAGLLDVEITSPQTGQVLTYDETTGKWVNGAGGGGGGGNVTRVAMTVPTGFAISGSPITSSGTLALSFASGYSLPTTADQENWDSAYIAKHTHSNKTSVLDKLTVTGGVLYFNNSQVAMAADLDDMATMTWVGQQSYATQSWVTTALSNYYTKSEADAKYMTIAAFENLFRALDSSNQKVSHPYSSSVASIKAMVGLWTEQYISALGQNSSGGGGGASTLAGLLDVSITSPQTGQVLTYDGETGKWINTAGGTVTAVTAGTGLSGGTITTSGTIAISSTYQEYIEQGTTAYGWGNHAQAGYLTSVSFSDLTSHPDTLSGYGITDAYTKSEADAKYMTIVAFENLFRALDSSNQKVSHPYSSGVASIKAMVGLWTNQYLSALGQNSEGGGGGGSSTLAGLLDVAIASPQTGQVLTYDEAAGKWVNAAVPGGGGGTVTSVGLTSQATGLTVTGSTITTSGTFVLSLTSGYGIPTTAKQQAWDNAASASHTHSNKTSVLDKLTVTGGVLYFNNSQVAMAADIADMATTTWVGQQNYATQTWVTTALGNYYTKSEADAKYMTIAAFENLFRALDSSNQKVSHPYSSSVASIKAMVGLWTEQYLSALGQNSSGGGGGAATLAGLLDVAITSPQTGQVLMYDETTGKWVNAAAPGGGGGTVTAVTAGTGLSGGTITTSGTISISDTYLGYIAQGTTAYGWGNHAQAGYLTSVSFGDLTSHPTTLAGYGITDVKFGTQGVTSVPITLGSTTKTVLTAEVDPTVPAWAKAASKPSYSFSELTSHPDTLAGYGITDAYTKSEADAKYMTIVAFENLFRALDSSNQKVSHPYSSGVASIKAMVGLWTEQYISALGLNSQGGGGAAALTDLVDVAITSPHTGQVLTYDETTGKWINGAGGGGGGGGVTRVAMTVPTGFSVSGTPITSSGTLALSFASGYSLPTTADQENWDSAYIAKHTHSNKSTLDDITGTKVDNWDNAYSWVNTNSANVVMQSDIADMATKTWVGNQGFQTASDVVSLMQNYAYISSGVIYIGNNSITPLTQHQTVSGTFWGKSWTNGGTVSGSIYLSSHIYMNATAHNTGGKGLMVVGYESSGSEEKASFGFHAANSDSWASGALSLQLVLDSASGAVANKYTFIYGGLRIGDGMLMWDSTNNAFKVIKADGTAANLYATGGVSALGMSAGASSIDAMTFGTLNVTNTLKVKKGSYTNDIYTTSSGKLYIEGNGTWIEGGLTVNDSNVEMSGESNLNMNGNRIYLTSGVYLYTDGSDVKVNINGTNYKLYKI